MVGKRREAGEVFLLCCFGAPFPPFSRDGVGGVLLFFEEAIVRWSVVGGFDLVSARSAGTHSGGS